MKKAVVDFIAITRGRLVLLRLLLEEFKQAVKLHLRRINLDKLRHDAVAFAEGKKQIDLQLSLLRTGSAAVAGTLSPEFDEALRHSAREVLRVLREGVRIDITDDLLRKLLRSKRKSLIEANNLRREFRPPRSDVKAARALIQEGNDVLCAYLQSVEDLRGSSRPIPKQRQTLNLSLITSISAADLLTVLTRSYRYLP